MGEKGLRFKMELLASLKRKLSLAEELLAEQPALRMEARRLSEAWFSANLKIAESLNATDILEFHTKVTAMGSAITDNCMSELLRTENKEEFLNIIQEKRRDLFQIDLTEDESLALDFFAKNVMSVLQTCLIQKMNQLFS